MAQIYNSKVMFKPAAGIPAGGMVIKVTAADNYAVVKPKINELLYQLGVAQLPAPQIHVTGPNHPEKTELKGNATLRSLGIAPAASAKMPSLCIFVNLPPEPKKQPACLECVIL
ncbi:hypothetical protein H4R19_002206 [Coemansia spiralis]|nr:hypothetical protein H4R19_002206 [Coemansia spiralis]